MPNNTRLNAGTGSANVPIERWLDKMWVKPETELLRQQEEMAHRFLEDIEKNRALYPKDVWVAIFEEGLEFHAEEYEAEMRQRGWKPKRCRW